MTYPVHEQPRDRRGRFAPGPTIVRRPDGEWSWTRWLGPEEPDVDLDAARACLWGIVLVGLLWAGIVALVAFLVLR